MEAVKSFQLEHGIVGSGVTDTATYTAIQQAYTQKNSFTEYTVLPGESLVDVSARFNTSIAAIMVQNKLSNNEVSAGQTLIIPAVGTGTRTGSSRSRMGLIQEVPWSIVDQLWKKGEKARIIDVNTGKSFQIKRLYGYYHADVEPLTKYDTQIFKEIYGGSWSWSRRAVIIQVHNLYLAASINGMPHGGRSIYNNNFPGQFCAHFLGSRVHNNSRVDPEHQAMIDKAANATLLPLETIPNPESLRAKTESIIL
jgi:LysM repeat protein